MITTACACGVIVPLPLEAQTITFGTTDHGWRRTVLADSVLLHVCADRSPTRLANPGWLAWLWRHRRTRPVARAIQAKRAPLPGVIP